MTGLPRLRPSAALAALAVLLLAAPAAGAAESAPVRSPRSTVALVSDTDQVAPGTPFHLGLRIAIAPGWHTYWRNPGEAGAPPEVALHLPAGATAGPIAWPAPRRIAEGPVMTYAYAGTVLLALDVTPPAAGGAGFTVQASAHWLVCKQICVPEHGRFTLTLPYGTPAPSAQAAAFAAAARDVPAPSPWAASVAPDGRLWVHGNGLDGATVTQAAFIPDRAETIRDSAPQPLTRRAHGIVLHLTPGRRFAAALATPAGLRGVLELTDQTGQRRAVRLAAHSGPVPNVPVTGPATLGPVEAGPSALGPAAAPVAALASLGAAALARLLGLAFLGGLILNLMPCVFPVLAMKAMALASAAAGQRMRAQATAYAAGVIAAFAALGGVLLATRAAGAAIGWGFQLASPGFVTTLAWLMFAVGLALSGVFETPGGRLAGAGQGLAARGGLGGSFFTGLLAVVVATPCTAPFMGAAIGGALAAPPAAALSVFLAMGAGLAAPSLLLAAVPALARAMPRPGRWMEVLRQLLAFPMYAAAAWLLWVVSAEAGPDGVLATAAGFVLLGFAAWALGMAQRGTGGRWLAGGAAALGMLAALALLARIMVVPTAPPALAARIGPGGGGTALRTEAFSAARLAVLRAAGRPVFVDMTAAWCVTCLVNERVALDRAPVRAAFARRRVALLVGDWTRQDPALTAYLRAHGRDGVPLYVFYPPGAAHGRVLPQLLTPGLVLDALRGTAG